MVAERVHAEELDELIPARIAAEMKGVTRRRILQYIAQNRLPARKVGPIFLIRRGDLDLVTPLRRGRPRKLHPCT